jgi:hypothetical protein
MCLRFLFLLITRVITWLRLSRRENAWKTAEILSSSASAGPPEYAAPRQRQPFMIMNPRSGGGKVGKFGLKDGGALEVKAYRGSPGILEVAGRACGRPESWQK